MQEKLKVPRKKWQDTQVRMSGINRGDGLDFFVSLNITFFVDDIKLENGKRGDRVRSQIYQEIFRLFKNSYLDVREV